jgi:hypothetical protein
MRAVGIEPCLPSCRELRQKSAPQTFTTKADAGRWLSRTQADIERGEFVDPMLGKVALADYSALWISTRPVRGRPLSPRTIELYRLQLLKHILRPWERLSCVTWRRVLCAGGLVISAARTGQVAQPRPSATDS